MSDQHHAGIMGCAGDRVARTPNLDRLAEAGTRFRNAYCTYPLCAPSRMSFMTARHPHELGLFDNEGHLGSDIPTFAHAFLSAGYDTVLSGRMHFVIRRPVHFSAERETFELRFRPRGTPYVSRKGWLPYTTEREWLEYAERHRSPDDPRVFE